MERTAVDKEEAVEPRATGLRMTYEAFLDWMDNGVHAEWVDGEVVMMAPVGDAHVRLHLFLLRLFGEFLEYHPLGELRFDPFNMKTGVSLPGRAPDIIFVANKNKRRLKRTHLSGPADLVVEIISPGSRGIDRGNKFFEYEEGGVSEYWLLDPYRKRAEFYRRTGKGVFESQPLEDDGTYHAKAIAGLWVDVAWFWKNPSPTMKFIRKAWKVD
jgi:Uma2 family endonuclease